SSPSAAPPCSYSGFSSHRPPRRLHADLLQQVPRCRSGCCSSWFSSPRVQASFSPKRANSRERSSAFSKRIFLGLWSPKKSAEFLFFPLPEKSNIEFTPAPTPGFLSSESSSGLIVRLGFSALISRLRHIL
ncbi:unnamed protein product, partial [Heterosigma akashiwo]